MRHSDRRAARRFARWWSGPWPGLALVLLLALLARAAMLRSLQGSIYADFLFWDEHTFDTWARALIENQSFHVCDQSSLYAWLMATVYRLAGAAPGAMRVANVTLGVATCGVIYGIGRELRGGVAGLASGLVVAVYRPFVFYSVTILKEPLGLLLFSLALLLLLACLRPGRRSPWTLGALGGVAALTSNVRQNSIALWPLLAVVVLLAHGRAAGLRAALRSAAALAGGFALLSAPFAVESYRETGTLSPVPTGGFNLYLGNNPASGVPFSRPVPFASSNPQEQPIHFTVEASRRLGRVLTAGEASRYWTRVVVADALHHPGAAARRLGLKGLAVLNRWEEHDNQDIEYLAAYIPALQLPLLTFGLILPVGLAGLCLLAARDRRIAALLLAFLVYALTLVLFWPNARSRAPLVAILVPAAVVALVSAAERLRPGPLVGLIALTGAFAAIERLPIPGAGDRTGALNAHALNLLQHDMNGEAYAVWRRSAAARGAYSEFALEGLALEALRRGDFAGARALVEPVRDDGFAAAQKEEILGDAWLASGDARRAAACYERSLAVNAASQLVRAKLMGALARFAPDRAAQMQERLGELNVFYGAQ